MTRHFKVWRTGISIEADNLVGAAEETVKRLRNFAATDCDVVVVESDEGERFVVVVETEMNVRSWWSRLKSKTRGSEEPTTTTARLMMTLRMVGHVVDDHGCDCECECKREHLATCDELCLACRVRRELKRAELERAGSGAR